MSDTTIEWTDVTWNPIRGCSVISPGCVNCYAMKQAHRFSGKGKAYEGLTKLTKAGPQWTGKVMLAEKHLGDPLNWRNPKRVFVNSMSDLFHESVPDEFISDVFAVMAIAKQHTFQVLTKRADRMREWIEGHTSSNGKLIHYVRPQARDWLWAERYQMPLPNVWLGVSVENQKYADERIPLLLQTPAAVRFVSYEPALGPVDLTYNRMCGAMGWGPPSPPRRPDTPSDVIAADLIQQSRWVLGPTRISWVIVGGESGPGARPFDIAWARSIVQQCAAAGVACFVKQLGKWPSSAQQETGWQKLFTDRTYTTQQGSAPYSGGTGKHGDPAEWPEDLRVRQFPRSEGVA